jgi:hypothetical protein
MASVVGHVFFAEPGGFDAARQAACERTALRSSSRGAKRAPRRRAQEAGKRRAAKRQRGVAQEEEEEEEEDKEEEEDEDAGAESSAEEGSAASERGGDSSDSEAETERQEERLDGCLREWRAFKPLSSRRNQAAFDSWWSAVEREAAAVVRGVDVEEMCEFLGKDDPEAMAVAALVSGSNVSDNAASVRHVVVRVRASLTPHVAVLGREDCSSTRHAVESVARQLLASSARASGDASKSAPPHWRRESLRSRGLLGDGADELGLDEEDPAWATRRKSAAGAPARRRVSMAEAVAALHALQPAELVAESRPQAVVVLEDIESIDPAVLRDVVATLTHFHSQPATAQPPARVQVGCVLCVRSSSSSSGLDAFLTRRELLQLRVRRFRPTHPKHAMEQLFERLFVDCRSPMRVTLKVAQALSDRFMSCDLSVHAFLKSLRLAAVDHFTRSRVAFLCCGAAASAAAPSRPLSPHELGAAAELKSTAGALHKLPGEPEKQAQVRSWVAAQEANRAVWPLVFRAVAAANSCLGQHCVENPSAQPRSARQEWVELAGAAANVADTLGARLLACTLETLDEVVSRIVARLSDSAGAAGSEPAATFRSKACAMAQRFRELRAQDGEAGATADAVVAAAHTSVPAAGEDDAPLPPARQNKNMLRRNLRELAKQAPTHSAARSVVAEWWAEQVARQWDARQLPLGELFFFRNVKALEAMLSAQPRSAMTAMLGALRSEVDVAVVFQILEGHKRQRLVPMLQLFKEFCAAQRERMDPRDREAMARFKMACEELEILGFVLKDAKDRLKVLTFPTGQ